MNPTTEQQTIIKTAISGSSIAITAFAGAAKTTTCVMVAKEINKQSLYIAFNKSIATEAAEKFPLHVECRTIHSLAYRDIITANRMSKKVSNFVDTKEVIELLGEQLEVYTEVKSLEITYKVLELITLYCQSSSTSLKNFIEERLAEEVDSSERAIYIKFAVQVWAAMTSKSSNVKMTPDVYLKMYQLSAPKLDYDVIYLDEAQDSNPVTLDIVYRQTHAQIIMVGDHYQSIYEWRGAINAFDTVPSDFIKLKLTESFRFNPEIAKLATKLTYIAGNDSVIVGNSDRSSVTSKAIVCRTNSSILQYLLSAVDNKNKVYVLADLQDLWGKMYHISALFAGSTPRYPNKELRRFSNLSELKAEAQHSKELTKLLNLSSLLASGKGTHSNITAIKSIIVEKEEDADFTITTCHKSKGLEWDEVTIDGDMLSIDEEDCTPLVDLLKANQTLNLLYVGITRARVRVILPDSVQEVIGRSESLRLEWND